MLSKTLPGDEQYDFCLYVHSQYFKHSTVQGVAGVDYDPEEYNTFGIQRSVAGTQTLHDNDHDKETLGNDFKSSYYNRLPFNFGPAASVLSQAPNALMSRHQMSTLGKETSFQVQLARVKQSRDQPSLNLAHLMINRESERKFDGMSQILTQKGASTFGPVGHLHNFGADDRSRFGAMMPHVDMDQMTKQLDGETVMAEKFD